MQSWLAPSGPVGADESFRGLYRHFCGGDPPSESYGSQPFPWEDPLEVRRIAVFRPGLVGDLILAMPGIRALRSHYSDAEIVLVAQPWAADLAERFPYIDRVLSLPDIPPGWDISTPSAEAFLDAVRAEGFDLVLQLHADAAPAARFALALGGRATAGFCADGDPGRLFHLRLPMVEEEPEVFRVLRLADALGARPDGVELEFPLLPRDLSEIEALPELAGLLGRRPLVVIHPGARPPARRWPLDRFARLALRLSERWGASMAMVGGPEEASLVERVIDLSRLPAPSLAGRLSLGGLGALLRRADLFVGNDSGPAQMAAAVAPRSVRIFGPANRRRWAPLDRSRHRMVYRQVECSPCGHFECPIDHRCLAWIGVEQVMAEVDALLFEAQPFPRPPVVDR